MDAVTQARLLGFMNQRHRKLLTKPGIKHLRNDTITFASVASQVQYVLPNIAKIERLYETTNDRTLYEISQQDWRLIQPDTTITGTPEAYIWQSQMAVALQPSDASSLFVKSTSAADTTQTVYLEGVITGNYPVSTSVTLTGTVAVNVAAATSTWIRVYKFYLSAACAGTVTLNEDSGAGTELARITIGKTSTKYTGIALWMTPSSVITYNTDVVYALTDFASATDEPLLPEDFHDLLVSGPTSDEWRHTKDERWSIAEQEYTGRVNDLLYWLSETAMGRPRSLGQQWQRPSQLGPYFPANS